MFDQQRNTEENKSLLPKSDASKAVANRWKQMDYKDTNRNIILDNLDESSFEEFTNEPMEGTKEEVTKEEATKEVRNKPAQEPIEIKSESESDTDKEDNQDLTYTKYSHFKEKEIEGDSNIKEDTRIPPDKNQWCFKLIRSEAYDSPNAIFPTSVSSPHLIRIEDILYDPNLNSTALFSYQYDLDFILSKIYPKVRCITMVAQEGTVQPLTIKRYVPLMKKTRIIMIKMPMYASHHTKMIINNYKDGSTRIFLPSSNFTAPETNFPQQVCWCSPRLVSIHSHDVEDRTSNRSNFKCDLQTYLKSYINNDVRGLIGMIDDLDFSPIHDNEVSFVYSTPNKHFQSGLKKFCSTLRYKRLLKNPNELTRKHFLCQTSSIGGSLTRRDENLLTHLMIPIWSGMEEISESTRQFRYMKTENLVKKYKEFRIKPYIIYPTLDEIMHAPNGNLASGWFNFHYEKKMWQYKTLRDDFKAFYKQDPERVSLRRGPTPSHSKYYMAATTPMDPPDRYGSDGRSTFEELDWCCYTSSNLSMNAWGKIPTPPRNYEAGVLLSPPNSSRTKLKCYSFTDLIYAKDKSGLPSIYETDGCVLVPFTLPVIPYYHDEYNVPDEAFNRGIHQVGS